MTLPAITLPKVELPFDIPVLLHPVVDHFMIALPVVILLLELINLIMKKKAIGGISFLLIFLTIFIAAGAYFTGLVDGKEAYPALGEAAKTALGEHKLLGTYLLLASVVLFFFKFLSAVTGNGFLKLLYISVLMAFVAGIYVQGQEGGELVYKHGMNVEKVKTLDDELFDVKDELSDAQEELEEAAVKVEKSEPVTTPAVIETPEETIPTPVETLRTEIKEEVIPVMKETVETLQVEGMPVEMIQPQIATH